MKLLQSLRDQSRLLVRCSALTLLLTLVPLAHPQPYSIDWHKVSGGGGTSTNGQYTVSGTIGQHDAGGPMTGSNYSVTGGFWALYAVQTPGFPLLYIARTGPTSVLVWWLPGSGSYTLQTNNDLKSGTWIGYGGSITSGGGTNSVTVSPIPGNLFFRLHNP